MIYGRLFFCSEARLWIPIPYQLITFISNPGIQGEPA
jgi:hypothetical protein